MKNPKPILLSAIILALFTITTILGCNKPDDDTKIETDLTTQLVGAYSSDNIYLDSIVIGKITNQKISVIVYRYWRTETYTSTLTSATAFQLSPTVQESTATSYTVYSGDGLLTPATNQLTYDYQWTEYSLPDSSVISSGNPGHETLTKYR